MENYTSKDLFQMEPEQLIRYLNQLCKVEIPKTVETVEDMQEAANILARLGPLYAFLSNMEMTANVQKRMLKKNKEQKEQYEEAITREYIFGSYGEQVKMLYQTVSRLLTIKSQINQELKMLGDTI